MRIPLLLEMLAYYEFRPLGHSMNTLYFTKDIPVGYGCTPTYQISISTVGTGEPADLIFRSCRLNATLFDPKKGSHGSRFFTVGRWTTLNGALKGLIPRFEKTHQEFLTRVHNHFAFMQKGG
jgi:hypothetical protein